MERDDHYLDSFSSLLRQYLDEVLVDKNCVLSNFRKHSIKNEEDFEFSLLLKLTIGLSFGEKQSFNQVGSSSLTEEDLRRLKRVSESWCLHLSSVSVRENKLLLKLNRAHAFCCIIKQILSQKSSYGKSSADKQVVKITSDDMDTLNLTEYRLYLLKAAAENLLKVSGYKISSTFGGKWIHFARQNSDDKSKPETKVNIVCGPVVNSQTKRKETLFKTSDYHKLRLRDMLKMSEKKRLEACNEQLVECLADSCVKITLLQTKSNQAVSLNLSSIEGASRETTSKGAGFLQYNASRMAAIRKKYERLVSEGLYTIIPQLEDLNFEVLKEPEEWALFFNFLLEYPSMINKISEEMIEGRANIHTICNFLSRLCSLFSAYYRRVRILLEPKTHLFPIIHARLVLVMSIEQVLKNGLAIMNIKTIEEM